jgi:hypothetical protein
MGAGSKLLRAANATDPKHRAFFLSEVGASLDAALDENWRDRLRRGERGIILLGAAAEEAARARGKMTATNINKTESAPWLE